jgi:hypothetical protein
MVGRKNNKIPSDLLQDSFQMLPVFPKRERFLRGGTNKMSTRENITEEKSNQILYSRLQPGVYSMRVTPLMTING